MRQRRKVGRPLLVATAGIAAVAYACGSQVSGNLAAVDSGAQDAGPDMNVSEIAGNLAVMPDTGAKDAPSDGG